MASSSVNTVKILVVGPTQSGKSAISNFISERQTTASANYRPTVGVRIVEFEKEAPKNPKRPGQGKVLIELWDCSGDPKYDNTWPAIQKGAHGILLVYNAENPKHESDLDGWVSQFPKKMGIPAAMCLGFAHHINGKSIKQKSKAPKGLANLTLQDTSIEEGASTIIPAFDKFFQSLMMSIYERQEKEENQLMEK